MDLELKLARLRRVGGWLSLICRFAQIASIGTILYCAAMMVLLVLDIPINTLPLPASNTLSRFSYIPAVGAVPPREQALIALFAVILTKFVLLRFLHFFWDLSKEIYSGETPFTSHNAVRLRRLLCGVCPWRWFYRRLFSSCLIYLIMVLRCILKRSRRFKCRKM